MTKKSFNIMLWLSYDTIAFMEQR